MRGGGRTFPDPSVRARRRLARAGPIVAGPGGSGRQSFGGREVCGGGPFWGRRGKAELGSSLSPSTIHWRNTSTIHWEGIKQRRWGSRQKEEARSVSLVPQRQRSRRNRRIMWFGEAARATFETPPKSSPGDVDGDGPSLRGFA